MSTGPKVTDWETDFDHLDPAYVANPYPIWDGLRATRPIAHTVRYQGVYLPTRHADIRSIAYDTEHFSSRRVVVRKERPPPLSSPPITSDPPVHRAHRVVLLPMFTPEAIKRHEPRTRAICRELITRLSGRTNCDGAIDYAQEIPVRVIATMLGISEEAGDQFRTWIHDLLEVGVTDQAVLVRAFAEIGAFFAEEIARRRTAPANDLISYLLAARIDGQLLSDEHIIGTLRLLLVAGIDTTWSAIGACLWHLATYAADRRRLVAEPTLLGMAVEEFLRAYAPVTMAREVVKDTQIGGCPFKAGQMVLLPFPAANRDPTVFPDADRVVIDRHPNGHAAFGLGIHRCLGSHLARMEITVALHEWLRHIPEFALAPDGPVTWSTGTVRGPRRLPLVLG
jgi:cytochrome P450